MRLDPVVVTVAVDSLTAQRLCRELPPPAVAGRAFFDRWPGVSLLVSGAAGRSCREDSRRLLPKGRERRAARQKGPAEERAESQPHPSKPPAHKKCEAWEDRAQQQKTAE
jgi:hypothetical protein